MMSSCILTQLILFVLRPHTVKISQCKEVQPTALFESQTLHFFNDRVSPGFFTSIAVLAIE